MEYTNNSGREITIRLYNGLTKKIASGEKFGLSVKSEELNVNLVRRISKANASTTVKPDVKPSVKPTDKPADKPVDKSVDNKKAAPVEDAPVEEAPVEEAPAEEAPAEEAPKKRGRKKKD